MLTPALMSRHTTPPLSVHCLYTQSSAQRAQPYKPQVRRTACFTPNSSLDVVEVLQRDHLQASEDGDGAEHDHDTSSVLASLVAKGVHELPGSGPLVVRKTHDDALHGVEVRADAEDPCTPGGGAVWRDHKPVEEHEDCQEWGRHELGQLGVRRESCHTCEQAVEHKEDEQGPPEDGTEEARGVTRENVRDPH